MRMRKLGHTKNQNWTKKSLQQRNGKSSVEKPKEENRQDGISENNEVQVETAAMLISQTMVKSDDRSLWYLSSFSYLKNIRVMAWIRGFLLNSRPGSECLRGGLSQSESTAAECIMWKLVQQGEFPRGSEHIRGLAVAVADDQLYHVKAKLSLKSR